jgi:hypothetical protein
MPPRLSRSEPLGEPCLYSDAISSTSYPPSAGKEDVAQRSKILSSQTSVSHGQDIQRVCRMTVWLQDTAVPARQSRRKIGEQLPSMRNSVGLERAEERRCMNRKVRGSSHTMSHACSKTSAWRNNVSAPVYDDGLWLLLTQESFGLGCKCCTQIAVHTPQWSSLRIVSDLARVRTRSNGSRLTSPANCLQTSRSGAKTG